MWKSIGVKSFHSIDDARFMGVITARCEVNASHKMKMKKISATNEIIDPIDEMTFHVVKESG